MEKIRVMIADDTDIAREGLGRILASGADMEVVGEGTTLHGTLQKVCELQPDILLLDLTWFGDEGAGISAIERLVREAPQTKVIAITIYPHLIEKARNAGALAALTKEVPRRQLIEEIRSVHALSPSPLPSPQVTAPFVIPMEELTKRELEVLVLMAEGKTDKEIANELGIAESTAKNHVGNILGKLNVPNRAGAVAAGYQLGLIGA
jgi:NarL family two-component system response regulator LiaR